MVLIKSNENKYLSYLDGLRAIAATYVALSHMVLQFHFDYSRLSKLERFSIQIFSYGHLAVNLFIVLSGFCLTIPMARRDEFVLKEGVIKFYLKRAKRVVLPYYFALLFSYLLIITCIGSATGTHWDISIPITTADFVTHLLLIHDLFSGSIFKINHALWTISVEFRIYLFFPLLLWVWRKNGVPLMVISTIIISCVLFAITTYSNYFLDFQIQQFLDGVSPYIVLFGLGMISAYISLSNNKKVQAIRNETPWVVISFISLIILLIIKRILLFADYKYFYVMYDILFGCLASTILIIISTEKIPLVKKALSSKSIVFIGTYSYSLYLIHAPLIQVFWKYIIEPFKLTQLQSYYSLIIVGIPLLLIISYTFYILCERRFMNDKKPVL